MSAAAPIAFMLVIAGLLNKETRFLAVVCTVFTVGAMVLTS